MTILQTERLLLRPFRQEDLPHIVQFYGTAEVMAIRKLGVLNAEEAQQELDNILQHWELYGFGLWAVIEKSSGIFLGECGLRWFEDQSDVEISYGLYPSFQGKGLATEAAKIVMDYGFEHLQLSQIVAMARADNMVSHRVLEKLGMQLETSQTIGSHGLVNKYIKVSLEC